MFEAIVQCRGAFWYIEKTAVYNDVYGSIVCESYNPKITTPEALRDEN